MSTGLRAPGAGRPANNTGNQTSSVTRAVSPPKELLGERAVDAWKRTNRVMIDRGTFEMVDCHLLISYCNTIQLLANADEEILKEGLSDETAAGGQKTGAAVKARDKLISQLIRLTVVLRLDPGSRVVVAKPGSKGAAAGNEFEQF